MIILRNTTDIDVSISDLGIQLKSTEEIDLLINFYEQDLLKSTHLKTAVDTSAVSIFLDDVNSTYSQFVEYMKKLTVGEHRALKTLKHNISENYFFETSKDVEGKTKYITYWADDTKTQKKHEEEVLRDLSGKVSAIILRKYDISGNLIETETQYLNRDASGKVGSISSII